MKAGAGQQPFCLTGTLPPAHVEVEVIPMSFVVVGAQDHVEEAARSVSDSPQERGFMRRPVPI
jgi:hypothetical protein